MIEYLFLDLDDTILDFKKAEYVAIGKTIADFGVEPTEEVRHRYHVINKWHWEQLELGTMTPKASRRKCWMPSRKLPAGAGCATCPIPAPT